jgi:hypothetical protein
MFQTAASHHHPRPCPLDLQEWHTNYFTEQLAVHLKQFRG